MTSVAAATADASVAQATLSIADAADGSRILTLAGRLDAYSIADVWTEARAALASAPARRVVVDASAVDYCDGAGIAMLVDLLRQPRAAEAAVSVRGLRPEFQALLEQFDGNTRAFRQLRNFYIAAYALHAPNVTPNLNQGFELLDADLARDGSPAPGYPASLTIDPLSLAGSQLHQAVHVPGEHAEVERALLIHILHPVKAQVLLADHEPGRIGDLGNGPIVLARQIPVSRTVFGQQ